MVLTKKEAGNLDGTDNLLTYLRMHIKYCALQNQ